MRAFELQPGDTLEGFGVVREIAATNAGVSILILFEDGGSILRGIYESVGGIEPSFFLTDEEERRAEDVKTRIPSAEMQAALDRRAHHIVPMGAGHNEAGI